MDKIKKNNSAIFMCIEFNILGMYKKKKIYTFFLNVSNLTHWALTWPRYDRERGMSET